MAASSNMVVCCIYLVCSKCQGYVYWFLYHSCILNKYHWARKTAACGLLAFCAEDRGFFATVHGNPWRVPLLFALAPVLCPIQAQGTSSWSPGDMRTARARVCLRKTMPTVVQISCFVTSECFFLMDYERWEFFVFLVVSRGHEFWVDLNVMKLYETVEFDQMRRLSTPSCPSSSSNYYTVWKYFCRDHFGWREYSEVFNTFQNPAFGL